MFWTLHSCSSLRDKMAANVCVGSGCGRSAVMEHLKPGFKARRRVLGQTLHPPCLLLGVRGRGGARQTRFCQTAL